MKIGDRVKCMSKHFKYITFNKIYNIKNIDIDSIYIIADDNDKIWYNKDEFKKVLSLKEILGEQNE